MKRCVIIGGAPIGRYDRIRALLGENDYYIYCDSGLKHREALGKAPDLIIGDFDSYEQPETDIETIKVAACAVEEVEPETSDIKVRTWDLKRREETQHRRRKAYADQIILLQLTAGLRHRLLRPGRHHACSGVVDGTDARFYLLYGCNGRKHRGGRKQQHPYHQSLHCIVSPFRLLL